MPLTFGGQPFDWETVIPSGDTLLMLVLRPGTVEAVLSTFWLEMGAIGELATVWPGGVPSLRWMLDWGESASSKIYGCFLQKSGEANLRLVGIGWHGQISRIGAYMGGEAHKAEVGMAFYPFVRNTVAPQIFSETMISWGFNNLGLEVVYGTIPTPNKKAWRFAERIGFQKIGTFPLYGVWGGNPCDCEVYAVTKGQWVCRSLEEIDRILESVEVSSKTAPPPGD